MMSDKKRQQSHCSSSASQQVTPADCEKHAVFPARPLARLLLIESGGGSIINISSGLSQAGDWQPTAYACTKGAINTMTLHIATQYGQHHVRCNALTVGLVKTSKLDATMPKELYDLFIAHLPAGRLGEPEDIAEMIHFLASDRSSWITGQIMGIDGGFFSHSPITVGVAEFMAKMAH